MKVQELIEKALVKLPWLNDYEDAWPVKLYFRIHLTNRVSRYKKRARDAMSRTCHEVDKPPTHALALAPNSAPCAGEEPKRSARAERSASSNIVISNPSSPPTALSAATALASCSKPNATDSALGLLRRILARCDPRLDHLTDKFFRHGVQDIRSFLLLGQLSEEELNGFLRTDLGLDSFRFRQVRSVLKDARRLRAIF